jgi:hypothetical protein
VAVATPTAPAVRATRAAGRGEAVRQAGRHQPAVGDLATERVPPGLASAFFALHGADVSDVPVRRGRAVSRQAMRLDAAAFSHDGVVYLPDSAGSLGQAPAQALLAHELTHAVQQRMLGPALPAETSAEGRELEDQAMATQRWFLGEAGPVSALALLPSGTAPARTAPYGTGAALTHAPAARPPSRAEVGEGVQRQPAEVALGLTAPSAGPDWQQDRAATVTADGAAPTALAADATGAAVASTQVALAELRDRVAKLTSQRPADLDDPVELDELAAKLYRRLRAKLRLELIVDRERAGLLTDFR